MNTPIEKVLVKLPDARQSGDGYLARCPAHEDRTASLSVSEGNDGRALVHCFAGCKTEAICAAIGLRVVDLMPTADRLTTPAQHNGNANGHRRIVATYDYRDEAGSVVFQAVRYEPKDFRQRRPDGRGGWEWKVKGTRVIPYRLPEIVAANSTTIIYIVEGEKDADGLAKLGFVATCNAAGAGKWTAEHAAFLRDRNVVILPDNDEPGRNHAQQVAMSLAGVAKSIKVINLPGLPEKGDVSDWIAKGGTKTDLMKLAMAAPEWSADAQPWPELLPFDALELPDFPTHVLPKELREWVEAESHATQTPPDMAALLALAVCSACIARRVVVEPRSGWHEPSNLYVAVLLEPGNRKSGVFADATKPLREIEIERIKAARPTVAQAQSDRRQGEAQLRKLEKQAAETGDGAARHEAGNLAAKLAVETEPVLPQLMADDATAEKLGMMLAEQGGRIASMSPEGGVFDLMAGLYSKSGAPNFGVYLMGHSGDDLTTDRVGRKSVHVERPALTCAYAMQPEVIRGLAEHTAFRGRGLLARFLYAAPKSWIGKREIAATPVSPATWEAYRQTVRMLAAIESEIILPLAPDAERLLREWENEIESMLADGGDMEVMRDWGAKLAGETLRLAAVLHCAEHGAEGQIATIEAAIEIARYLIPHADAVLTMMTAKEGGADADAQYVLRWIVRHNRRDFTKSEAQHHGKRRFPKAEDIDAALADLMRRGYIRQRPAEPSGPGRPPSPAYDVNPAAIGDTTEKRSRYSYNSPESGEIPNCGNKRSASERIENQNRVRVTL